MYIYIYIYIRGTAAAFHEWEFRTHARVLPHREKLKRELSASLRQLSQPCWIGSSHANVSPSAPGFGGSEFRAAVKELDLRHHNGQTFLTILYILTEFEFLNSVSGKPHLAPLFWDKSLSGLFLKFFLSFVEGKNLKGPCTQS